VRAISAKKREPVCALLRRGSLQPAVLAALAIAGLSALF
jgi:hypothetical protein